MQLLKKILSIKEKEVQSLEDFTAQVEPVKDNRFKRSITESSINLICEIKPASPSEGSMVLHEDLKRYFKAYKKYAAAISVLTDREFFQGGYDLLNEVGEATGLPTLQKDFVIDKKQIACGAVNGASAVLIIVKILDDDSLKDLTNYARRLNLEPVLEVNSQEELKRALSIDPEIILINNRNLDSLKVDLNTARDLAPHIPESIITIGASGYSSHCELKEVNQSIKTFLIGSSLMKSDTPESRLESLVSGSSKFAGVSNRN